LVFLLLNFPLSLPRRVLYAKRITIHLSLNKDTVACNRIVKFTRCILQKEQAYNMLIQTSETAQSVLFIEPTKIRYTRTWYSGKHTV
jgi:hypothetical protein